MPRGTQTRLPVETLPRVRRGYFECRYGQLHVHNAMPPGGGFEEGTPLLCVHDLDLGGSGRVFTRLLAAAGQNRSVYAPDIPGFGESDPPPSRPALADYAAALGDFLDNMRLRHVALLGLRMGALLAAELALARPQQIGRVVMVSVPLLSEVERKAPSALPPPAAPESAFRPPQWQRWALEAAAQYPLRERLAKLTQRLLVLRLRDDLSDATARVLDMAPAARVSELDQPALELLAVAPQRIVEAIREFLRG
jgi:pimeloyl-ACP methyl ester carboxylesterase